MKRIGTTVCLLLASVCVAFAQQSIVDHLTSHRPGEGTVTLVQDAVLSALLDHTATTSVATESDSQNTVKASGFRVQVFAGNNSRTSRGEAHAMAEKVKELFPELSVYTHFVNPRWLCRVGDFRSIEEADAAMRKLKATGSFHEVSIVRETVNIHY